MAGPCLVRRAEAADLDEVAALEQDSFPDPWTRVQLQQHLGGHFWVLESAGEVVGYAVGRVAADEAEILSLAVRRDQRGRGHGGRLVGTLLEGFQRSGVGRVYLEVRVSNVAARMLYGRSGFREIGRRRGYYSRPVEDALLMGLNLGDRGHE